VSAFIVEMPNSPGSLASLAEALGKAGVNITAVAAAAAGPSAGVGFMADDEAAARSALDAGGFGFHEVAVVIATLEHRPGTLASAARRLADAGVNVELVTPTAMTGGAISVAFGVSDGGAARAALGNLVQG
jgi:hypothetical protein